MSPYEADAAKENRTDIGIMLPIAIHANEALAIAVKRHQDGQLSEADRVYRAVLAVDPDHPDALHFLGVLSYHQGQVDKALPLIRRAIEQAPLYADAHNNLGNVLKETGAFEAAREAYEQAITINPRHVGALNNLGVVFKDLNRLDDAVDTYRKALAIEPENAEVMQNLGNAYRLLKRFPEAVENFRRAIALRPYDREAYRCLAATLYIMNERDEAVLLIRQWLAFEPASPAARHLLAAYTGEGIPDRASDAYVHQLFDEFAGTFEAVMGHIDYQVPGLIAAALQRVLGPPKGNLRILDAGCGTGLCAETLRRYASRLVGVDLSEKMLAKARGRGLHNVLIHGELETYMTQTEERFDVIVTADTLCYFGRLDTTFAAARRALDQGGYIIFTVEAALNAEADDTSFRLNAHGRYSHAESYVRAAIDGAGLKIAELCRATLRMEMGKHVEGLLVSAAIPAIG
jgi:predicted TPR repeat methyltransferase